MQAAEAIAATYLPEASTAQLHDFRGRLQATHAAFKAAGRELNLTRGKPATEQVALSDALLTAVTGRADCLAEDGTDCTNYYGNPQGLIETRRLFVFTHAETRAAVERCHELMMQGFDALGNVPERKADSAREKSSW